MARSYNLSPSERETIIRRADDEDVWDVYTCSPSMARKLLKMSGRPGILHEKMGEYGWRFKLPTNAIRFVAPRQLSDAEKEQRRRALAQVKEDKPHGTVAAHI